jgi:hypothetical protein
MKINILTGFIAIIFSAQSLAQKKDAPPRIVLMGAQGVYQTASGDWSNRFNDNFGIGAEFGCKFSNGFILSLSGIYAFGGVVTNPAEVVAPLLTNNDQILNSTGGYAIFTIYSRATYSFLNVERVMGFWKANQNSGPTLSLGGGYLWHWINIDNAGNDVAALENDFDKGYDNLSHGYAGRASLGYLYLSKSRLINFKLSFEIISAYTRNVRGFNYATGPVSDGLQNNLLYGLKLNWYIPIYRGGKTEEYYFD